MAEMYSADECFTTGTMGELVPAIEIDKRTIGKGEEGPVTDKLQKLHHRLAKTSGEPLPF
jgi:branched-subunit amino acid aminotransferase/4-amino-4-deoxychorismate lyase